MHIFRYLVICLFTVIGIQSALFAQIFNPVAWTFTSRPVGGDRHELLLTARVDEGWNIYSQFLESDDGPIRTTIYWDKGSHFTLLGKAAEEGDVFKGYDDIFGMNVIKLSGNIVLRQQVRVLDPSKPITGLIEFMACDKERCLPPGEASFRFALQNQMGKVEEVVPQVPEPVDSVRRNEVRQGLLQIAEPRQICDSDEQARISGSEGLAGIFFLGLLGGFLAFLTPCVFPMVPLTVSYFTKGAISRRQGTANALLYGFFIVLVYLLLSVPFHLMDSIRPDILNDISTNVWLNLFFFLLFIAFAISFFGYFELALPESWTNKASRAEGVGGVVGIFFMALTLALVSFSCTGPILGSLLAGTLSSDSGAMQLSAGMGGFGLALALPFGLFAAFPGLIGHLPKSGGWMNSVKIVLGFLELALALKFLSNADLVKHWGIVKIEVFLGIWIILFAGLAAYLFGLLRIGHESRSDKRSLTHILLGVVSLLFTVYLVSGFRMDERAGTYRSLTGLSGMAPPACYSLFYECRCPHNLNCFKDLEEGMAYARSVNKPVMLDFTGYACVNCRKMEEHVWPVSPVYSLLKDRFVIISLYVDDKTPLPPDERIAVTQPGGNVRILKTIGNKWSHLQTSVFQTNSQPYYVLVSPNGELLNQPVAYVPDVSTYEGFLQCGLEAFEKETLPAAIDGGK